MKRLVSLVLLILTIGLYLRADEGMWVISTIQRNYAKMKALGCELSPDQIYSINHSSLKDVVVALDGGSCTAEIVSPNGLLLTNHHCGYEEIQSHSTVEHDYLKKGFWAASYEDELPNPGKEAWFLVRVEDVTDKVLAGSYSNIDAKISYLEEEASEGGKYFAEVKDFYDGNKYYLFVYLIYKDIRLVGAPPESIGKYGGDTDNWMWPRHTGDFSIFRIYAAPDGSPREYSPDNVPLKTDKYLKLNIKGVNEGDFAMILGYPGTTTRYLTSWEVEEVRDHENAIRIQVRDKKLSILKSYMDKDQAIRIKYAANYAQSANYYKYSVGQNLGIKRLNVIQNKINIQKKMSKWIAKSKERKQKYGHIFKDIKKAIKARSKSDIAMNYWFEAIYLGSDIIKMALNLRSAFFKGSMIHIDVPSVKKELEKYYRDFDPNVDKDLMFNLLDIYRKNTDKKYLADFMKNDTEFKNYIDNIYSKSLFVNKDSMFKALDRNPFVLLRDPAYLYMKDMLDLYFAIKKDNQIANELYSFDEARRLYMDAYLNMAKEENPDTLIYPDANSTMRVTYGKVKGYSWEDKTYRYYTTIDGYIEKGKKYKDNPEFEMDPKMVELYNKKDFGRYADKKDGTLHLCFLTDNDITGGNSGSPVINGKGELIGVAFDGNWEAMSGDIVFEEPVQRTICVDIRYVLFVIDKVANAQRIMNELTIVE